MISFAAMLAPLLQPGSRVVLLANNPGLTAIDLHNLGLGAADVLVQFNRCPHAALLAPSAARKLYCFMANHHSSNFGFAPNGEPEGAVARLLAEPAAMAGVVGALGLAPQVRARLAALAPGLPWTILWPPDMPGFRYPAACLPSSGYLVFHAVRACLAALGLPAFIYCVGFTGRRYGLDEPVHHDFAFERAMIARSDAILYRCWAD